MLVLFLAVTFSQFPFLLQDFHVLVCLLNNFCQFLYVFLLILEIVDQFCLDDPVSLVQFRSIPLNFFRILTDCLSLLLYQDTLSPFLTLESLALGSCGLCREPTLVSVTK